VSRKKRVLQALGLEDEFNELFGVKPRGAAPKKQPVPRPEIENIMAYPPLAARGAEPNILAGRPMYDTAQATYAMRNMSPAELEDALASGVFRLPPSGKTQHGEGKKWWSPADEEGVFGRNWVKGGGEGARVRVPISDFSATSLIPIRGAQRWDAKAKKWVPLKSEFAVGGLAVKRKKK
jgi:hypothetical protein